MFGRCRVVLNHFKKEVVLRFRYPLIHLASPLALDFICVFRTFGAAAETRFGFFPCWQNHPLHVAKASLTMVRVYCGRIIDQCLLGSTILRPCCLLELFSAPFISTSAEVSPSCIDESFLSRSFDNCGCRIVTRSNPAFFSPSIEVRWWLQFEFGNHPSYARRVISQVVCFKA